jgi:hypothetical protein
MSDCHSTTTPVDTKAKLSASDGAPIADVLSIEAWLVLFSTSL